MLADSVRLPEQRKEQRTRRKCENSGIAPARSGALIGVDVRALSDTGAKLSRRRCELGAAAIVRAATLERSRPVIESFMGATRDQLAVSSKHVSARPYAFLDARLHRLESSL